MAIYLVHLPVVHLPGPHLAGQAGKRSPGPGIGHRAAEAFLAQRGLVRDVALVVPSFSAAAMMAASTDLLAGLPRRVAEVFAATLPIRILTLDGPALRFQIQLVWHERTHTDAGAQWFRDLVIGALATTHRA